MFRCRIENRVSIAVLAVALAAIGCGKSDPAGPNKEGTSAGAAADSKQSRDHVAIVGQAYLTFDADKNKTPAGPDDLASYLKDYPETLKKLKAGDIVVFYNGKTFSEMVEGGGPTASETIIAYMKEVPEKGGYAVFGDTHVQKLTADEFKKAPTAKK